MSRYFQFIKFHVFWSSWDTLGNKTKLPPRQYFHLGPICFDWLWSVAWGKRKTGSANWTLHNNPSVNHWEIDDWWLITDQGCIIAGLSQEGQYWTLPLTSTRHPSPTTWAPWPRWHTGVWLWFCVASWQNEAWVGGCSVQHAGVSRLNLTCLCSLLPTILKQMDLPSVCFYSIITFCNNCKLFSLIIVSELKKRTLESKHIHAAPDGSTWMTF